MEAKCRASLNYIDQLYKFHTQNGTPLKGLPLLESKPMDLYLLKETVELLGGYRIVSASLKLSLELYQSCLGQQFKQISQCSQSLVRGRQRLRIL